MQRLIEDATKILFPGKIRTKADITNITNVIALLQQIQSALWLKLIKQMKEASNRIVTETIALKI